MRTGTFAVVVLLAVLALAPASPAPEDYSINVHVTRSYVISGHDWRQLELDAVINGKKYQLRDNDNGWLLAPGEYKARLVVDRHNTAYESQQRYEFLFPDKKVRKFSVEGQSE